MGGTVGKFDGCIYYSLTYLDILASVGAGYNSCNVLIILLGL